MMLIILTVIIMMVMTAVVFTSRSDDGWSHVSFVGVVFVYFVHRSCGGGDCLDDGSGGDAGGAGR